MTCGIYCYEGYYECQIMKNWPAMFYSCLYIYLTYDIISFPSRNDTFLSNITTKRSDVGSEIS